MQNQLQEAPKFKMYVLLKELDSNAPIYRQVSGGKRVQITKRPVYPLFNQITFQDENGDNKTIRFMNQSNTIWQDEQIKAGLLANVRYSPKDRTDLVFRNGMLGTNSKVLINYLDTYPGNENFKGLCDVIPTPIYKELDPKADNKKLSANFLKRVNAASKIAGMSGNVEELSALLIRLNGISFVTSKDPGELLNMAIEYLDDADDQMLDLVLKEELNVDESARILVGQLINAGVLKFDNGTVSKLKANRWLPLREMGEGLTQESVESSFVEYLNSESGKNVKKELELEYDRANPKEVVVPVVIPTEFIPVPVTEVSPVTDPIQDAAIKNKKVNKP